MERADELMELAGDGGDLGVTGLGERSDSGQLIDLDPDASSLAFQG